MGGEKVVMILDASKDLSDAASVPAIDDLPLSPGDELTLLGVLHEVTNPSKLMASVGYKTKVNSNLTNSRIVGEEFARKKEQLRQRLEILEESTKGKIKFDSELEAGPSRKVVAVEAAKSLGATWIILDRVMKKDKKYFLKNLSCKISKLKRNNTIEQIRGPLETVNIKTPPNKSPNINGQVSYDEMIPGDSWEELHQSPKRSPRTLNTSVVKELDGYACGQSSCDKPGFSCTASFSDSKLTETIRSTVAETRGNSSLTFNQEQEKDKMSPFGNPDCVEMGKTKEFSNIIGPDYQQIELLQNSICSACKNRRPRIGWHRDFSYAELYEATAGFSNENFLGEGGFGSVYKGELKNGLKVAVKQRKDASLQGDKEFGSEVEVLREARHQNLVLLLGSCSDGSHRLLVYEYVCNGSLDQHLSKAAKVPLTWEQRIKIALGAAKGLEYLHSRNIVHRDMRPNNILITHDHESLLGDFGLARTQHDNNSDNSVVGTLGYVAPEYALTGKVSTKTDVYSFGIVLLQLITGRRTTDKIPGGKSLIRWAKPLLKDRNYPDLIDRRIIDSHDVLQLFLMVRLTEKCLSNYPSTRFTMEKVVNTLKCIKDGHTTYIGDFSPISELANSILDPFDVEESGRTKG